MEDPVLCAICKNPEDTGVPFSTLTEKGSSTINHASNARKDSIHTVPGEKVHQVCRRKYCNPHQIAKGINQEESMPCTSSYSKSGAPGLLQQEWCSRITTARVVLQDYYSKSGAPGLLQQEWCSRITTARVVLQDYYSKSGAPGLLQQPAAAGKKHY